MRASSSALSSNALVIGSALVATGVTLLSLKVFRTRQWRSKRRQQVVGVEEDDVEEVAALSILQWILAKNQFDGTDQTVCCVILESGSCPSEEQVQKTVSLLKKRHSPLRAVLAAKEENQEVVLVVPKSASSSGMVDVSRNKNWRDEVHEQLNCLQFPRPTSSLPTIPLWKVVLVDNTDAGHDEHGDSAIVFALNHVQFDGTSRNRFLGAFFDALGEVSDGAINDHEPVPYNLQTLTRETPSMAWSTFFVALRRHVHDSIRLRHKTFEFPLEDAPGIKDPQIIPETKWITSLLSQEETTRIIQQSKQEGTTVHGAVSAALYRALDLIAREKTGNQTDDYSFSMMHMISLWGTIKEFIPAEAVAGCFIGVKGVRMTTTAQPQNMWDMARGIKAQLQGYLPWNLKHYVVYMLVMKFLKTTYMVSPAPPAFKRLRCERFNYGVSNNGLQFYGNYSKGVIKHVFNNVTRHSAPDCMGELNLCTVHGSMNLTFAYYTHIWSEQTALAFVNHFKQQLLQMCGL
ncbi:Fungal family of unknown function (DUF1776) [Seminavis robusta]|uniref:Uncharacterized protein n=1 Tax=Seminavis robusta TaxID=568900 RepID=A0A9N8HGF3_9STRA|nr:Fungal family of unknown function (DUF1776) [Seminavis robusta]|eukprot:Sro482_g151750.1 Fungal family of unknown function (DUF1776) (517) ;mRNA; r:8800-10350